MPEPIPVQSTGKATPITVTSRRAIYIRVELPVYHSLSGTCEVPIRLLTALEDLEEEGAFVSILTPTP